MRRVQTGVINLDQKIEGGFPENSTIILIGPPSSGKTIFCNQFVYEGVKNGESAIYVTFEAPPDKITDFAKKFGWELESKIIFIDASSWRGDISKGELYGKYVISQPSDLNEINIKIIEAIRDLQNKNPKRFVIDSLTPLLFFVPHDLVLKFLALLTRRIKALGLTQLITLEKKSHPQDVVDSIIALSDGCIELDYIEGLQKRVMRIVKMFGTKFNTEWFTYDITDKGIEVSSLNIF